MELPTTRKLHDYIDRHFYKSLYIFPLVAASTWFVTITTLLIRWLTMGRPRYPGQYNPDIPLISDIAAFTFKPVFVIGGTLTGLAYFMTVLAVHHVRYSPKFYGPTNSDPDNVTEAVMEPWWRKAASGVALVAGLGAATCLVLLSVFDTYDSKVWHRNFLMGTFLGLAVSAIALVVVWWDHTSCVGAPPSRLRFWANVNLFVVFCQTAIGIAFVGLFYSGYLRPAGILEWTLTYLGTFWMATHLAYVRLTDNKQLDAVSAEDPEDPERQPLLING